MTRHLIVGLGNPGPEYAATRHNAGFMAIDELAGRLGVPITTKKFRSLTASAPIAGGHSAVLLKPQTFMNVSGAAVLAAAKFYQIEPERIVVLHDELDLALGVVRIKQGGGHGGHNGLRDIIHKFGGVRSFVRVRLGIGRPARGEVTPWVLGAFAKADASARDAMIEAGAEAAEAIVREGVIAAQNRLHA